MLIITVPPLTEERRKDLVRRVKAESENAKVAVRNHRKEAMDMVKTLKEDGKPQKYLATKCEWPMWSESVGSDVKA